MPASLFKHVLIAVASPEDAEATLRAAHPYIASAGGEVTVIHVIEKAGGAPDKASVEQREDHAREMFDTARETVSDADIAFNTQISYGTDVAATIIETANNLGASAIIFTPRDGSRWVRLLTGDVALSLVSESNLPVLTLPDVEGQ